MPMNFDHITDTVTNDAAIAIGEEAFIAGFRAAAAHSGSDMRLNGDDKITTWAYDAWNNFEPSEAAKALTT